jgi:hypothetical protein
MAFIDDVFPFAEFVWVLRWIVLKGAVQKKVRQCLVPMRFRYWIKIALCDLTEIISVMQAILIVDVAR